MKNEPVLLLWLILLWLALIYKEVGSETAGSVLWWISLVGILGALISLIWEWINER